MSESRQPTAMAALHVALAWPAATVRQQRVHTRTITTFAALLLLLSGCATAALQLPSGVSTHADGRVPVEALYHTYAELIDEGWHLDIVIESRPAGTDYALPVIALRSPLTGPAVWIISGIHGEEPAGPQAIAASIADIAELGKRKAVVLLPLCNPHGYVRNWRYLNMPVYSADLDGASVGDSSHLLPDVDRPGYARAAEASSPEANAITAYLLTQSAEYPPAWSFDLHEDNLINAGYVYSQGVLGADDPLARKAVRILQDHAIPIKTSGATRFDDDIRDGIVGPVVDSSIDELMSAAEIVRDGRSEPGPATHTVLTFETPAGDADLKTRIAAYKALLGELANEIGEFR
jgi:hypothetical protein